jgi:3-phosphoshikimate 1-carboxyvinyltransferase
VLDSEDTQVMVEAWKQLGLSLNWNRASESLSIDGCAGILPCDKANLFVANSGTTIRFLTAALAVCRGEFVLDGVARMQQRPIEDLLIGLRQLGADVQSINSVHPNCPPVRLRAEGLRGGVSKIAGNVSSQFLSGLMMAAPYAQSSVGLQIEGELVSKPYVSMTAAVMKSFGCEATLTDDGGYSIQAPQRYRGCHYAIEPDASAASYFWAAAAITGGRARVEGLSKGALQGDVGFVEVLKQMGSTVEYGPDWIEVTGRASRGIDVDMNAISDTVQTLAAVAIFAEGPTRVRGVAHNRHKETDRIGDLATELRKLGARIDEHEDGLTIHPAVLRPAEIETYNDHRMAMSLGLVGLRQEGVWILNPKCTEKTYPNYFEAMGKFVGRSPIT